MNFEQYLIDIKEISVVVTDYTVPAFNRMLTQAERTCLVDVIHNAILFKRVYCVLETRH